MNRLQETLAELRHEARPEALGGMARFGLVGADRLGLSMPVMRRIAKRFGRDHTLALALWETGIPDARIVAGLVADPAQITSRQMDAWAADFASWDVCDQVCLGTFVASPHAWRKVQTWSRRKPEFVRRSAFSLLAMLAVHDKSSGDARFITCLPLIEAAADDDRNFVKKAVNWALRGIGKRNQVLNDEAVAAARRLARSDARSARWIASDALRELCSEAVLSRLRSKPKPPMPCG